MIMISPKTFFVVIKFGKELGISKIKKSFLLMIIGGNLICLYKLYNSLFKDIIFLV